MQWLKVSTATCTFLYNLLTCSVLQIFREASEHVSGSKYTTLSSSLHVYTILHDHVLAMKSAAAVLASPDLVTAVDSCYEKLMKYMDVSTFQTEYYYYATGEFNLASNPRRPS